MTDEDFEEKLAAARLEQMEADCEVICDMCRLARLEQTRVDYGEDGGFDRSKHKRWPTVYKRKFSRAYRSWETDHHARRWHWGQFVHLVTSQKGSSKTTTEYLEGCKAAMIRYRHDPRMASQDDEPEGEHETGAGFEEVSARMAS